MVLVNGMGSVGGPIVGGAAVGVVAPDALFVVMAVAYVVIGSYALFRMTRRAAPSSEERASFTPTAVGVGPTIGIGDADVADLFPVTHSLVDLNGIDVSYREQLLGRPVGLRDDRTTRSPWAWRGRQTSREEGGTT